MVCPTHRVQVRYDATIEVGAKFANEAIQVLTHADLGVVTAVTSLLISLSLSNPEVRRL